MVYSLSWSTCLLLTAGLYLALVRSLRYRCGKAALKRFPTRESYRSMTLDDAFEIQSRLAIQEFPTVFSVSIFFALFKTYGIPSISRLLAHTGQLAQAHTASKRAADTGVILTEVFLHHPSSPRARDGIARMNYLHSLYRKAGEITDADMLYTLSLFALEPIRWTQRFEWRQVNEVERCAMGTYWRFMGEAMEVPFTLLPSNEPGWTDGLHFLNELTTWSEAYEYTHMIPAESNRYVVSETIDIGLYNVPKFLHSICLVFVAELLEPHVREAMMIADPHPLITTTMGVLVGLRKFLMRFLCLPRPYFLRERWWTEQPNAHGKFNATQFISLPWYIAPTLLSRWGPKAWILRLVGGKIPGDDGDTYLPDGYAISEIGPEKFRDKGRREMERTRQKLASSKKLGCPFANW